MSEDLQSMPNEQLVQRVQQLEANLALLEAERQKQFNLEYEWSGNLGHWQWDISSNCVTFNSLKATALGYNPSEIDGPIGFEFFTEKLHPEDYERVMENMRSHLFGKSDAYEVEYRIHCKSGDWKWYYDRGVVTKRDPQGKPILVAGIVFDITKSKVLEGFLKETNRELALSNASKNRFFSILAHDLRGPIGSTAAILAELVEGTLGANDLRAMLRVLKESAEQTYRLLENLLSWSSMQNGSYKNHASRLTIDSMIAATVKLLEPQLLHKNLRLKTSLPKDLEVWADDAMINTMVRNLISNAIKFSYKDGQIEIAASANKDWVCVSVKDYGLGMTVAQQEKLFSLTESAHGNGTEGETGSGLGLILCNDIALNNGGELKVVSQLGKGSTLSFVLPMPKAGQV